MTRHACTTQPSAIAQSLYLHNNRLSGTIPEYWWLPQGLQVHMCATSLLLLLLLLYIAYAEIRPEHGPVGNTCY